VQADAYDKIDRQLLGYVEDVLLNRREDATERILEFAALLDPKSAPTAVKRLDGGTAEASIVARLNPIPADFNPVAVPDSELPPVPEYKAYV
jgi:5-methyltetrahydrofolate--homocysteine methyltransferase